MVATLRFTLLMSLSVVRLARLLKGAASLTHVGAGTKRPARSGHDDGAHIVVRVGEVKGATDLMHHPRRESIELVGPVESQCRNAILNLIGDLLEVAQFTALSMSAQYGSLSLNFCSLPVAVRASSLRKSTDVGHL